MYDERSVRRSVLWMNLAQPIGHVRVESGDEGNARRAAEPRGADACDGQAEHQGKRCDDPSDAHAARQVADRLNDALEHTDLLFADGDEQHLPSGLLPLDFELANDADDLAVLLLNVIGAGVRSQFHGYLLVAVILGPQS